MSVKTSMWRIDGDAPKQLSTAKLPTERELHQFLLTDPTLLGAKLLVIGSEVPTPHGGRLDLLAIDGDGNLQVLELKRDRTPREVVAQVLDYASWVSTLSRDEVIEIANRHLTQPFEAAFEDAFGSAPPDELNTDLQVAVVASEIDASSERIITYLRTFGVPVNVVFFSYLEDEGRRYLTRSWLVDAEEAPRASAAGGRKGKRADWNGVDWYVSFGEGTRSWQDAREYGFVSAGGGEWYSRSLRSLPIGARVNVHIPQTGYVGVGEVIGAPEPFAQARVMVGDGWVPLADQTLRGTYRHSAGGEPEAEDAAEWVVPVRWIDARPKSDAYWEKGMFANQNSACQLRQEFTLERLAQHFNLDEAL